MATANQGGQVKKVALLWEKPHIPPFKCNEATVLYLLRALIAFVFDNLKDTDVFHLIIPGHRLEEFLSHTVCNLPQVHIVEVFYESDEELKRAQQRFQGNSRKLRLCHIRNLQGRLQKLDIDQTISRSGAVDRMRLYDAVSTITVRVATKLGRLVVPISSISRRQPLAGYDAKNKHEVDPKYICSPCQLILRDPCQLICGHRQCQSCVVRVQNITVTCSTCYADTLREHVWIDRAFRNEMQDLPIRCSICNWAGILKFYQEHIDQIHSNHLTMVEPNELINCSVCNEQVVRSKIDEHFRTEIHQSRIVNLNASFSTHRNDQDQMVVLNRESFHQQRSIQNTTEELHELQTRHERMEICHAYMQFAEPIIKQELQSLKQHLEDSALATFNGIFTWKIDKVHEKMIDAQSERQPSIYSPPFYTTRDGYKMCIRLFLNGDGEARDSHISIFFVIMRGEFDARLRWPFNFQVIVHLLDQLSSEDNHQHITNSFWCDPQSISFQRPSSSMNIASGIPKIFIKIQVDLVTPPPANPFGAYCIMVDGTRKQDTNEGEIWTIME